MRMALGKLFSAPYTGFVSPKCPFSWLVSGSFMPQAGGSVALLIWKSDPSENKVETRVPASGPFCRVTGLALTLSVEEAHLSITGLSSRPHCVSFKVLSLVSCLGKRDIHGAATGLRHVLIQFPKKKHSLCVADLEKDAPSGQKPSMGTWLDWQVDSLAPFSSKM